MTIDVKLPPNDWKAKAFFLCWSLRVDFLIGLGVSGSDREAIYCQDISFFWYVADILDDLMLGLIIVKVLLIEQRLRSRSGLIADITNRLPSDFTRTRQ